MKAWYRHDTRFVFRYVKFFILLFEIKWYGCQTSPAAYRNERDEKQLLEYLDYYHLNKGYLVSFCFNKDKAPGTKTIQVGDKTITEAVI